MSDIDLKSCLRCTPVFGRLGVDEMAKEETDNTENIQKAEGRLEQNILEVYRVKKTDANGKENGEQRTQPATGIVSS